MLGYGLCTLIWHRPWLCCRQYVCMCVLYLSLMCDSLCHVLYVSCVCERCVLEAPPVLMCMHIHRGPQSARIQAFHLMLTGPSPGF